MSARAVAAEEGRQLVASHNAGHPDAYAEIYRRYRGDVYAFIWRRVRNRELAQDLTHDTFAKGLRAIDRWQWQGKDVGAWLIKIAHRLVIDHFNTPRSRYEVKPRELEFGHEPDETRDGNVEDQVIEHLRNLALLTALQNLTSMQRACIVYRFIAELTVAQTATEMSMHENAIKGLQWRAIRALGHHFDEEAWL